MLGSTGAVEGSAVLLGERLKKWPGPMYAAECTPQAQGTSQFLLLVQICCSPWSTLGQSHPRLTGVLGWAELTKEQGSASIPAVLMPLSLPPKGAR